MSGLESTYDRVNRARELVRDIRAGQVRSDGEHAASLVASLCAVVDELLTVVDDNYLAIPDPDEAQIRLRDELLAEVPASQRASAGDADEMDLAAAVATLLAALPDSTCAVVTRWLRAARRDELTAFRRDVREGAKVADDIARELEIRVTAIEEVLAARWPRRWWLAARLRRATRTSVRDFPGATFTGRRFDATSTEGTADMIRRAQDGER